MHDSMSMRERWIEEGQDVYFTCRWLEYTCKRTAQVARFCSIYKPQLAAALHCTARVHHSRICSAGPAIKDRRCDRCWPAWRICFELEFRYRWSVRTLGPVSEWVNTLVGECICICICMSYCCWSPIAITHSHSVTQATLISDRDQWRVLLNSGRRWLAFAWAWRSRETINALPSY